MADFGIIAVVAVFYEISIFLVYLAFVWQVKLRNDEKKNQMTALLLKIFEGYAFGLFFSIISKMFNAIWGGVPYEQIEDGWLWVVGLLHSGRLGFVSVVVASILSYNLYNLIFRKEIDVEKTRKMKILGAVIIGYLVIGYNFDRSTGKAIQSLEIVAFVLLFVYMLLVYIPFYRSAFKLAHRIEEPVYQRGIRSLGYMAISFILIFFSLVLDRLMLILINWAYSIFYFAAWIFVLSAVRTAYTGYIKPRSEGKINY
jgi:hypothetical protein